jgi:hypothetical protein
MDQFKAWCTRNLRERFGGVLPERLWTERGSKRWIDAQTHLENNVPYVVEGQDRKG